MPNGNLILLSPDGAVVKEGIPTTKSAAKLAREHAKTANKQGVYKVLTFKSEIDTSVASDTEVDSDEKVNTDNKVEETAKAPKKAKFFT